MHTKICLTYASSSFCVPSAYKHVAYIYIYHLLSGESTSAPAASGAGEGGSGVAAEGLGVEA